MMYKEKNKGFTLVELMVSLVVGLLIVLGAGQLYLNGFHNFRQVEVLSDKQAVLTFAAYALIRDIRRADANNILAEGNRLGLRVDGEDILYSIDDGTEDNVDKIGRSLILESEGQPLVSGLIDSDKAFEVDLVDGSSGLYKITMMLRSVRGSDENPEIFIFHAMNRTKSVNPEYGSSD